MRDRVGLILLGASIAAGVLVAAVVFIATRGPKGPLRSARTANDVRAQGRCEECHARETPGIFAQYAASVHAQRRIGCAECHAARPGLTAIEHHGFQIVRTPTSGTCAGCHRVEYEQFTHSRHAMPAMAAVTGNEGFTPEIIAITRQFHPEAVDRPANSLPAREGLMAMRNGCVECHQVGRQNADGSVGDCTVCHGRHVSSAPLADAVTTCGSCHMGPDHSQLEIWQESRHGVLSALPDARERGITATCSTCHMSGSGEHQRITHDTSERLSLYLFAPITTPRPNAASAQQAMTEVCVNCHARATVNDLYTRARQTVENTNRIVAAAQARYAALVRDGCVTPDPWDEPVDIVWFELWHHFGRTAKHGAFMGGADYTQWHGNYEILKRDTELRQMDDELRRSGRCRSVGVQAADTSASGDAGGVDAEAQHDGAMQ